MRSICVAVSVLMLATPAAAQWAKFPDSAVPRSTDGDPDLTAPAPRAEDGKVDLSGVWLADNDPNGEPIGIEHMVFPRYFVNIAADLNAEDVPFQPAAAELFEQRLQNQGTDSPIAHCKPTGVPHINSVPIPHKIVQTSDLILVLYEENTVFRQIFLDGRQPVEDPLPRYLGYSTGRWEGDTLVVDTVGFPDGGWLDGMGHPHSDKLHVIERFRRIDVGHMTIETMIDDPGVYTRPITFTVTSTLFPDDDLLEYFCTDNEKDVEHYQ
jgi:hypothetical protein